MAPRTRQVSEHLLPELSWPLFFLGEVGLRGEIVKREGAGSSEGFSTLQSLRLEVAAALSHGGRGAWSWAQSSLSLGTPTDVSLPAKTRGGGGGGEEEEEREPALGTPWGEGLRMGYRETKVQIPSLRGTAWGLDPQTRLSTGAKV